MSGRPHSISQLESGMELPASRLISGSRDLDQARDVVSGLFVEHKLRASKDSPLRSIDVRCQNLEAVSLCYFDYGRALEIDAERFEDFYLLLVPLSGAAQVKCSGERFVGRAGKTVLMPADRECGLIWSEDTRKLVVRIDRRRLTAKLEAYLGANLTRSPRFDLAALDVLDRRNPLLQSLQGLVSLVSMPSGPGRALMASSLEDAFMGAVLYGHPSDMSDAIRDGAASTACPKSVRRAEQYIEAHLAEPITIDDLARTAGTSARSLFQAFKSFRDMSPMAFVRFRRLHAVRDRLKEGGAGLNVSTIAANHGFAHLGRFSAQYARQFGETPSETLRNARN